MSLTQTNPNVILPLAHNVQIDNDSANWLRWGRLVAHIVSMPGNQRPQDVKELRDAMAQAGVNGHVQGKPDRGIAWVKYSNDPDDAIVIPLPNDAMLARDEQILRQTGSKPPGHREYPLPIWYSTIFGNAAKVDLGTQELLDMGFRRLGEYVINECM